MKVEDLLKVLHDAGLQDEEIKALLEEALANLGGEAQEEQKEEVVEETEDDKMNRVFGI